MRTGPGRVVAVALAVGLSAACTSTIPPSDAPSNSSGSPFGLGSPQVAASVTPRTEASATAPPSAPEATETPASGKRSCLEGIPSYLPEGFRLRERSLGTETSPGVGRIYEDPARPFEREIYVLSGGLRGEGVVGAPTGRRAQLRGQDVDILFNEHGDDQIVYVIEGSTEEPCHLYEVIGVGLTEEEFERVVRGIGWHEPDDAGTVGRTV